MSRKKIKVYADGVDWQHEIGNAAGGNRIYGSVEDLKKHEKCWKGCGIVEAELVFKNWAIPQDMEEMTRSSGTPEEITKRQITDVKAKIRALEVFLERLEAKEKKI